MRKRGKKIYDEAALYEYAVGALARRMRSVAELKRLMRHKMGETENAESLIEAVVSRLKHQQYLNDSRYAEAYSSYRRDNEKFGRLRVISDLKGRGVHGDVIEKAVSGAYSEVNDEQLARAFLRRKRHYRELLRARRHPERDEQAEEAEEFFALPSTV